MTSKNPPINHLNFYCIKQIDYIFPFHVTACKELQSRHSTSSRFILFRSLHAATSSVIYYSTHTRKKCYLVVNSASMCRKIVTKQTTLPGKLKGKNKWPVPEVEQFSDSNLGIRIHKIKQLSGGRVQKLKSNKVSMFIDFLKYEMTVKEQTLQHHQSNFL